MQAAQGSQLSKIMDHEGIDGYLEVFDSIKNTWEKFESLQKFTFVQKPTEYDVWFRCLITWPNESPWGYITLRISAINDYRKVGVRVDIISEHKLEKTIGEYFFG